MRLEVEGTLTLEEAEHADRLRARSTQPPYRATRAGLVLFMITFLLVFVAGMHTGASLNPNDAQFHPSVAVAALGVLASVGCLTPINNPPFFTIRLLYVLFFPLETLLLLREEWHVAGVLVGLLGALFFVARRRYHRSTWAGRWRTSGGTLAFSYLLDKVGLVVRGLDHPLALSWDDLNWDTQRRYLADDRLVFLRFVVKPIEEEAQSEVSVEQRFLKVRTYFAIDALIPCRAFTVEQVNELKTFLDTLPANLRGGGTTSSPETPADPGAENSRPNEAVRGIPDRHSGVTPPGTRAENPTE